MSVNAMTKTWAEDNDLHCHFEKVIPSTNNLAKTQFENKTIEFELYLADHQPQGRGRGSNDWADAGNGDSLLSTWCFRLKQGLQPIVTPLIGLALENALQMSFEQLPLGVKPPNDILTSKGKLGGLLIEMSQKGSDFCLYVGLGLNVKSAPKVDAATSHITEFADVTEKNWGDFCSRFKAGLVLAIEKGHQPELASEDQQRLLESLNRLLPEEKQYHQITSACDLIGPTGTTPWTSL